MPALQVASGWAAWSAWHDLPTKVRRVAWKLGLRGEADPDAAVSRATLARARQIRHTAAPLRVLIAALSLGGMTTQHLVATGAPLVGWLAVAAGLACDAALRRQVRRAAHVEAANLRDLLLRGVGPEALTAPIELHPAREFGITDFAQ